jgi:hypothetical protein
MGVNFKMKASQDSEYLMSEGTLYVIYHVLTLDKMHACTYSLYMFICSYMHTEVKHIRIYGSTCTASRLARATNRLTGSKPVQHAFNQRVIF